MSEEMWHVQIEPGEVKHLTLEQLDDMFRLDLISADTLVWQPGMPKALPLSVVAGIDEDEEEESEVMEIEPELIPEPAYSSRSVAPAPTSARYPSAPPASLPGYHASAAVSAWPAAPAPASVRPAPVAPTLAATYPSAAPAAAAYPSVAPAPTSARYPTMAPPVTANAVAPVVKAPIAPALPSADFYSPESLRPITMSEIPALRGSSGGHAGKVMLGLAIAAGLLVTLYRNDLLRPMAESAGQASAYEKLESALGAPGFGTPQAVTEMSATLNPEAAAALSNTSASAASPTTTTTTTTTTDTSDDSDTSGDSDTSDSSTSENSARTPTSESRRTQAAPTTARRVSGSAPAPRAKTKETSGKGLKAYKGSEYDPMNAKL